MSSEVRKLYPLTFRLFVAGAAALSCGPSTSEPVVVPPDAAARYAEAMCGAYEHCGCLGEELDDIASCRSYSLETFRLVESWPDVRFNQECFEDFLNFLESASCESTAAGLVGLNKCLVFDATVAPGESCTPLARLPLNDAHGAGGLGEETCSEGLSCILGRCQAVGGFVDLGGACSLEDAVVCGDYATQDLYCSPDGICHQQVGAGQACDSPFACQVGEQRCRGIKRPGDVGVCGPAIALGEPCDPDEADPCEVGAWCSQAGVCEPWRPAVCDLLTPGAQWVQGWDWIPAASMSG